jgi:hypothetical protein
MNLNADYFLNNSYASRGMDEFILSQSPDVILEVRNALAPKFKALSVLSESAEPPQELDHVFEMIQEFHDRGIPEEFIQEGVERAIVEGWWGAGAGAVAGGAFGGPAGAVAGAGIGSLLGSLLPKVGGGFMKSLTQWAASKVLNGLGMDTDSGFGLYLTNAIAEAGPSGVVKIFSGDCDFLAQTVVRAIPPFVTQSMGLGKDGVGNILNHTFTTMLNDTNMLKSLTKSMSTTVCAALGMAGKKVAGKLSSAGKVAKQVYKDIR